MTATATRVRPKRTSGRSTWRATTNARRSSKLDRKTRQTNCNNIFRWYRSGWGRYTQFDPDRESGVRYPYAYVGNRPTVMTDPLGLKAFPAIPPLPNIPPMPGPIPDPKCCSKSAIDDDLKSVNDKLKKMADGKYPSGTFGGVMTIRGTTCTGTICSYVPEDPSLFNRQNFSKDKCVDYCANYHEWVHFVDTRSWDNTWGDVKIGIFQEWPGYIANKACLNVFRSLAGAP